MKKEPEKDAYAIKTKEARKGSRIRKILHATKLKDAILLKEILKNPFKF